MHAAAFLLTVGLSLAPAGPVPGAGPAGSVTRPMQLDHGRVIVDVEFVRADGGTRWARVWVDTGNQELLMGRDLARDLGLGHPDWPDSGAFTMVVATSPAPAMRFGTIALDHEGLVTRVRNGNAVLPGLPAEACLPARALRRLCAVFDYPASRLTLGRPGAFAPRGTRLPCRVNPETGLPMVTATLDGAEVPLGVDTGSAGTWLSDSLTGAWQARHPGSPRAVGAAGSANFFGFPFEPAGTLLSLTRIGIGGTGVDDVAALALDSGFFRWYSRKSAGPVAGFLGANVLNRFRLTVDFANGTSWWQGGATPGATGRRRRLHGGGGGDAGWAARRGGRADRGPPAAGGLAGCLRRQHGKGRRRPARPPRRDAPARAPARRRVADRAGDRDAIALVPSASSP